MCDEFDRVLGTGHWLAEELVKHLEGMAADKCTIPVRHDGEIYEVEVRRIMSADLHSLAPKERGHDP